MIPAEVLILFYRAAPHHSKKENGGRWMPHYALLHGVYEIHLCIVKSDAATQLTPSEHKKFSQCWFKGGWTHQMLPNI